MGKAWRLCITNAIEVVHNKLEGQNLCASFVREAHKYSKIGKVYQLPFYPTFLRA